VALLINNAGIEASREDMEVNVLGPFALTRGFAPVLAKNGDGGLVNILSVVSLVSFPSAITYSASMAAAHSITQATRSHLRAQGTYVAGAYAGPVDTDMGKDIPMEKVSPESFAQAILKAIEAGVEDILPDVVSLEMGKAFFADPKALERQVGAPVEAAAAQVRDGRIASFSSGIEDCDARAKASLLRERLLRGTGVRGPVAAGGGWRGCRRKACARRHSAGTQGCPRGSGLGSPQGSPIPTSRSQGS
jgi:NAD(P)-dependent dehydrogenase (short-subunit alcohol dehydrogenase family)